MNALDRALALASLLLGAAGCYGDALLVSARGNDAGVAMQVQGSIAAQAAVVEGADATYNTRLSFTLVRAGAPVDDATVTITSEYGAVTLERAATPGTYLGGQRGYAERYTLEVASPSADDAIHGAVLQGPTQHALLSPRPEARLVAQRAIDVRWTPFGGATATISTRHLPETVVPDTGFWQVPADAVRAPADGSELDAVTVQRSVVVPVPGASSDSRVTIDVQTAIEVVIYGT